MSKYVKGLLQTELERKVAEKAIKDFLVVSLKGVNGVDGNLMRGELKDKGIYTLVVKNSLFARALNKCQLQQAVSLFYGPCAIAYATGDVDIVSIAKEFAAWQKKIPAIEVKGAFVENSALDTEEAKKLSRMPTRKQMQGQILTLTQSPASTLLYTISSAAQLVAGYIKAVAQEAQKQAA
ncbi:MAG: 50S ribosomal protein L10 [Sedimentisphaerales bacterium]|nr:50S ribosomal protein L10 [Sedimentisphaerales bacterium]